MRKFRTIGNASMRLYANNVKGNYTNVMLCTSMCVSCITKLTTNATISMLSSNIFSPALQYKNNLALAMIRADFKNAFEIYFTGSPNVNRNSSPTLIKHAIDCEFYVCGGLALSVFEWESMAHWSFSLPNSTHHIEIRAYRFLFGKNAHNSVCGFFFSRPLLLCLAAQLLVYILTIFSKRQDDEAFDLASNIP